MYLYHLWLVTRQCKSQHLLSMGVLHGVCDLGLCRDVTLGEAAIVVAPVLCFSPLLGEGAVWGEMGRRKAEGLDDSSIAWTRVQIGTCGSQPERTEQLLIRAQGWARICETQDLH